jgi:hypothetical protein
MKLRAFKLELVQNLEHKDQFALEILAYIKEDENYVSRLYLFNEETFHVCEMVKKHSGAYGKLKVLMMPLNMSLIHRSQCVVHFDENQSYGSSLF